MEEPNLVGEDLTAHHLMKSCGKSETTRCPRFPRKLRSSWVKVPGRGPELKTILLLGVNGR